MATPTETRPRVNLRKERLNLGMDERTFAAACGVNQPVIQRLERPGRHWVKPKHVKLVADYLTAQGIECAVVDLLPPHVLEPSVPAREAA